jgi:hypothetical protein
MDGSEDFSFGANYAGAAAVDPGGVWSGLPTFSDILDKLGTAGLTRAAYEINKPLYNAGAKSGLGTFGKVGTVGVELGTGTQTIILLIALGAGIYLLTR